MKDLSINNLLTKLTNKYLKTLLAKCSRISTFNSTNWKLERVIRWLVWHLKWPTPKQTSKTSPSHPVRCGLPSLNSICGILCFGYFQQLETLEATFYLVHIFPCCFAPAPCLILYLFAFLFWISTNFACNWIFCTVYLLCCYCYCLLTSWHAIYSAAAHLVPHFAFNWRIAFRFHCNLITIFACFAAANKQQLLAALLFSCSFSHAE